MKIVLDNITSGYNLSKINDNFEKLAQELQDKVLYRDNPEGEPNQFENDVDLNSNDLLNVQDLSADRILLRGKQLTPDVLSTSADQITFTPAGEISSTEVQAALEEMDTRERAREVNTVEELLASDPTSVPSVTVLNYHSDTEGGGGLFYWDAGKLKSEHNGGTVIDPTAVFPTDWDNQTQLAAWFDASNAGSGCWVRQYDGEIFAQWFGVVHNSYSDQSIPFQRFLTASAGDHCRFGPGFVYFSQRLNMIGAGFDGTWLQGHGRDNTSLKPMYQGLDGFLDILRMENADGITISDFEVDGTDWLESVAFEERVGEQWARVNPRDVTNWSAYNLKGTSVGNFLQMNNVIGFNVSNVIADDVTLVCHFLGTTKTGVVSNVYGTRIVESILDWGGGGGENVTATNIFSSGTGAWRSASEGLDMGGARNVTVSNSVFTGFESGLMIKGESDVPYGDISINNCIFKELSIRGITSSPGISSLVDFGHISVDGCIFEHSSSADTSDIDSTGLGMIRLSGVGSFSLTNSTVISKTSNFNGVFILNGENLGNVTLVNNDITALSGGVIVNQGSAQGLIHGIFTLRDNRIKAGTGHAVDVGTVDNLTLIKGNVIESSSGVGVIAKDIKNIVIRDNEITSAGGHGVQVEARVSGTFGGIEHTFIGTDGVWHCDISSNRIKNFGTASTFRNGISLLRHSTAETTDIRGFRASDNTIIVDAALSNSQRWILLSSFTASQLDYSNISNNIVNMAGGSLGNIGANSLLDRNITVPE